MSVEAKIEQHNVVVDWQSNLEVRREMRRDVKREAAKARVRLQTKSGWNDWPTRSWTWPSKGISRDGTGQRPLRRHDD